MLWDVFCRVIDNFGDIGVCWRLSADLANRGHSVRLWVDDASALEWMAPEPLRPPGIQVLDWDAKDQEPGDIVIEAFGCNPPDAFVARMQRPAPPVWINLEYLSAENWVERCHGLRSPVMSGPGAGLSKWFFYPGFTQATGGLLRETDLMAARQAWEADHHRHRDRWLSSMLGISAPSPDTRWLSLFCYEPAPVEAMLEALATSGQPTLVLVTPGFATALSRQWQAANPLASTLTLHELPPLSQREFDHLLWACDLNMVRGEDSAVRALWAGQPHIWHIYPQDDGVHAGKLEAFMDRWMSGWPDDLAADVRALWLSWNGLKPASTMDFEPLSRVLHDPRWAASSRASRQRLAEIPDLVTQLCGFVLNGR
ncbi:MAG: elongation factor P maturation arginine rhamnosyltransferase EarP [Aquabacterium sp.]|uniref:elongation factor P maturation arginine rhamnosyltransferase EarP n=1 Tax=Aquabacterium sp. TaxID=1872578 RepID=UPI0027259FD0|nr:elongation factor P maturation arginine rhamnosyltransferase EarP [Aquabacterium sp.]MDO9005767.1 elongation factor P maturation arginine rhamnosyltransferase EarP [Aquabacterium sp.]